MKKTSWFFAFLFISANLLIIPAAKSSDVNLPALPLEKKSSQEKKDKNYKEGEIIIQYKSKNKKESALTKIKNLTDKKDLALEVKGEIDDLNIALIKSSVKSTSDLIEEFKTDETIEFAEPNYIKQLTFTPNDSYYPLEWHLNNTGQSVDGVSGSADADIDAAEAWDIESIGATNTVVAVIDNGVQYSHADLINNMWDGTVCVDDLGAPIIGGCPNHGWDYANNDNDPYAETHGTFIASLIGGENNNSLGVSGLSRYNHLKVMSVQFDLTVFTELKSINFAKNNGAKVINASFVGTDFSQSEKNLIESFNGIVVAAAGNDMNNNDLTPFYPCSYNSANIICVGSSSQTDALSSFSNYGTVSVDIMAPGENMVGIYNNDYYAGDGTSFATPLVTGITALLYSHRPAASPTTVRETLLKSSDHFSAYSNSVYCGRRLNARTSLQSIINNSIPSETCLTPIYRIYNTKTGMHVYSRGESDRDLTMNTWPEFEFTDGAPAFYAPLNEEPGLTPIYRVYNTKTGAHVYARGEYEKQLTLDTWPEFEFTDGVPAFYASLVEQSGLTPIYRVYNTKTGAHVYTRGEYEKQLTLDTWPEFEFTDGAPAFYAPLTK